MFAANIFKRTAWPALFCLIIPVCFSDAAESNQLNDQRDNRLSLSSLPQELREVVASAASLLRQGKPAEAYTLVEKDVSLPAAPPEVLALGALSLARDNRAPRALRLAELLTATPGYRLSGLAILYDVQSRAYSSTLAVNTVSSRMGDVNSSVWTKLGETYAEILTEFAAKTAAEVIDLALPIFQHAAAVSMQEDRSAIVLTHLRLADLLSARNDIPAVIESLRRALDAEPDNREALVRLAVAMIEQGSLLEAAAELEKVIEKHPDYLPALTALIELYVNLEKKDQAIALMEKCLERADFDSELGLAELAARINAWGLTYKLSLRARDREPESVRAHIFLVESALREKLKEEALTHAGEAYAQFPNSPLIIQMAVVAAREAGKFDLAEIYLNRLEKITNEATEGISPKDVMVERAILAERRNDLAEMERQFRRVLEIDPDNHFAMNYMAYTFADRGIRLEEALGMITKAISLEPQNSAYLDTLGWVHYMLGDFAKAYEFISQAAEIGPPHEEIFENLGDAADALGRHKEALTHWRKSLELQPDRPFVAEKIQAVERGERLNHPLPYIPPPGTPPLVTNSNDSETKDSERSEHTKTDTLSTEQKIPKSNNPKTSPMNPPSQSDDEPLQENNDPSSNETPLAPPDEDTHDKPNDNSDPNTTDDTPPDLTELLIQYS